jgi:hypothetical protein
VVTWQLNPTGVNGTLGAAQEPSQPGYTTTARGFYNTPNTDASHQYSFRSASESTGASETSSTVADALKNKIQAVDLYTQQESRSALPQSSAATTQPDESLLFVASNTPARSTTELDEAMAKTFNEEFVSVPTVQFASTAPGSQTASLAAMSMASGPDPVPVPEMSALFPIVGLIAAVSCTQILRRRRAAQQSAARTVV